MAQRDCQLSPTMKSAVSPQGSPRMRSRIGFRLPQGRNPDAQMVRLSRRPPVPPRQPDRSQDGLAVRPGAVLNVLGRKSRWIFPVSEGNRPRSAYRLDNVWHRVSTGEGPQGRRLPRQRPDVRRGPGRVNAGDDGNPRRPVRRGGSAPDPQGPSTDLRPSRWHRRRGLARRARPRPLTEVMGLLQDRLASAET